MQYRIMPATGDSLSALGFGCMRLPEKNRKIDRPKARRQIFHAIDNGINYFDTAFPYHFGESEPFLGDTLRDGLRSRVKIATKLPPHAIKKPSDMDGLLNNQLIRLKTDHIDYYLLHGIDGKSWSILESVNALAFLDRAKADGRIVNAGFSFHGYLETFKTIVDAYNWQFCQIQYNYLDEFNQAGTEGLHYAADRGLGVIVMEPLRGGALAGILPGRVASIFEDAEEKRSPAEWALRWVWNHPEVTVVLSGMNTMDQLEENIKIAATAYPGTLRTDEQNIVDRVKTAYTSLMRAGCTACRYCMPCPSGVNIPMCFEIFNRRTLFGERKFECLVKYAFFLGGLESDKSRQAFASRCTACGKCLEKCPQKLDIPALLEEVRGEFEGWRLKFLLLYGKYFFARLRRRKR